MVCAAAPLAALAGVDAFRAGGNAYDAAVAAALAETILLPPKCGFGGDLVAVVVDAGGQEPEALLAIGGAPRGLADVAISGRWREVGPTSVGPPAAAAGYAALAERGRLGRAALAARAIDLAVGGFPWATVCTQLSVQARELVAEMNPAGTVYYPDGQPIAPAVLVRLGGLAAVLEEWVARGAELLGGPVGQAIVEAVTSRGGVLVGDDLALATAEWAPCRERRRVRPARGGRRRPPPTGPRCSSALTTLERGGRPGDLAAQYRAVVASIGARGGAPHDRSGTSMVSAADRDGTVVTVVHSNSFPRFGSGIVVPVYDLVLANRAGRGFDPTPGHPNFPASRAAARHDAPRLGSQRRRRRAALRRGRHRAVPTRCRGTCRRWPASPPGGSPRASS